jgi:hypothetical protein
MSVQKPFSVAAGEDAEDEQDPPVEAFVFVDMMGFVDIFCIGVEC